MACGLGLFTNSVGIFLVHVSETLGVGRGPLSFYMTIMFLVMTMIMPFSGKILSKYPMRRVLTIAFAVNYVAFASLSLAKSLTHFYVVGAIIGFGGAFSLITPVPIIINNWFKKKLGLVMGFVLAFSGVGGVLFNMVGSFIIMNYGWRAGYLWLAIIAAFLVLPCTIFIIRSKPEDIGLKPYGGEEVLNDEAPVINKEAKNIMPKIDFGVVFKSLPIFSALAFTGAISLAGAMLNHIPAYSSYMGYSTATGGIVVSVLMIGISLCKIVIGYLHDRYGVVRAILASVTVGAIGVVLLSFSNLGAGFMFVGAFLYGTVLALTVVAPPLFVKEVAKPEEYNYVLPYVNIGTTLFSAIGVSIFGFIFDFTQSYTLCFMIIFAMIAVSYVTCLLTRCRQEDFAEAAIVEAK